MSRKPGHPLGPLPPESFNFVNQKEMMRFYNMAPFTRLRQRNIWIGAGVIIGLSFVTYKTIQKILPGLPHTMTKEWKEEEAKLYERENYGAIRKHKIGEPLQYRTPELFPESKEE